MREEVRQVKERSSGKVRVQLDLFMESVQDLKREAAAQEMGLSRFVCFLLDSWVVGGRLNPVREAAEKALVQRKKPYCVNEFMFDCRACSLSSYGRDCKGKVIGREVL